MKNFERQNRSNEKNDLKNSKFIHLKRWYKALSQAATSSELPNSTRHKELRGAFYVKSEYDSSQEIHSDAEVVLTTMGAKMELFGHKTVAVPTADYDDIHNGIDAVVTYKDLAFGVDYTTGTAKTDNRKRARIIQRLRSGQYPTQVQATKLTNPLLSHDAQKSFDRRVALEPGHTQLPLFIIQVHKQLAHELRNILDKHVTNLYNEESTNNFGRPIDDLDALFQKLDTSILTEQELDKLFETSALIIRQILNQSIIYINEIYQHHFSFIYDWQYISYDIPQKPYNLTEEAFADNMIGYYRSVNDALEANIQSILTNRKYRPERHEKKLMIMKSYVNIFSKYAEEYAQLF